MLHSALSRIERTVYNHRSMTRGHFLVVALLALGPASVLVLDAAEIEGKWKVVWDTEGGIRQSEWNVTQEGNSIKVDMGEQVFEGTVADNRIAFEGTYYASEAGYKSALKVEGTLEAGVIKGKGSWDQYAMTFTAKRAD